MLNKWMPPNGSQQNLGWPPCWKWSLVLAADNLTTRCFGSNGDPPFLFAVILTIFDEDSVFRFEAKRRLRRRYFLSTWHFPYEHGRKLIWLMNIIYQFSQYVHEYVILLNVFWELAEFKTSVIIRNINEENVIWKIEVVVWWFSVDIVVK